VTFQGMDSACEREDKRRVSGMGKGTVHAQLVWFRLLLWATSPV
jgi:hypothetical protein